MSFLFDKARKNLNFMPEFEEKYKMGAIYGRIYSGKTYFKVPW